MTTDKARTAAIYRRPSKDFEDQASGGRPSALHLARSVPLQGGIPIEFDGQVIGAIGVSGATSADEDNELALVRRARLRPLADGPWRSRRWRSRHSHRRRREAPRPAGAAARPARRDGRPPDRRGRGARRRRVALHRRARRRDRLRRARRAGDPTRSGRAPCRTAPTTSCRTPRRADFDDSGWQVLAPADTMRRLANGRVSFNWYRIEVTIPEQVGDLDPAGRRSCSRSWSTTTPRCG